MALYVDELKFQQLDHLELLARQVVEGYVTGLHKSPFHGFSVEFAEHRIYNPGESIRHIDWKLFGRSDKLFVKKFEEETNLQAQLVIDNSSSMNYPHVSSVNKDFVPENKLLFSAYSAAALIYMLRKQRDAVGLGVFSENIDVITPCKTKTSHAKLLYHELNKLIDGMGEKGVRKSSIVSSLHRIAENIHKRSLVVIFSDMMDSFQHIHFDERGEIQFDSGIFSALQHLRYNKHEVILFHVVDKSTEIKFDFGSRPIRFVDTETGDEVKLQPELIKKQYIQAINQYKTDLKVKCGQYQIDYVEAEISEGYNQVLTAYMVKRAKLH